MKCLKCGSDLEAGQKICNNCGAYVENTTNSANKDNKKKNLVIGIIVFVAVIFLVGVFVTVSLIVNNTKNKFESAMQDFVEGVNDVANEEKELVTKLDWKTPFVKVDKTDYKVKGLFSLNHKISDLSSYDVYGAIISVNYNIRYNSFNGISSDTAKVVYDTGMQTFDGDYTTYYYPIYIAVNAGESIENIKLIVDNNEENVLDTSNNNVSAIKDENTATYGDCLTCTLDGCRMYLIMLEYDVNGSVGFINGKNQEYNTVGSDLKYIYIIEGKPQHSEANVNEMFKLVSEDPNIKAIDLNETDISENDMYVADDILYIKPSGNSEVEISYAYKKDSMEIEEARKVFNNNKLKLKFINTLIDYVK